MFIFPYSHSFFFNDTATTEIYTLSLHDALPISMNAISFVGGPSCARIRVSATLKARKRRRSEEHTSELQSQSNLVCRLLLEKKKKKNKKNNKNRKTTKTDITPVHKINTYITIYY